MIDLNKEREDFIEAMKKNGCPMWMFESNEDGNFEDMTMAHSWHAWQEKAKDQAVPDQTINEIQSWVAVQSIQAMKLDGEAFVVGANELAEFIEQLVKSEPGAEG